MHLLCKKKVRERERERRESEGDESKRDGNIESGWEDRK